MRWRVATICLLATAPALAQTPGSFQQGQTLNAAQLNAAFALKQDYGTGAGAFTSLSTGTLSTSGAATIGGPLTATNGGTLGGTFGGAFTLGGTVTTSFIRTPNNNTALSGSTNPTRLLQMSETWTGSSTIAGNTTIANSAIVTSSDNAAIPNGTRDELLITGNYGGASFDGSRAGSMVQMNFNTPSTLSAQGDGGFGYVDQVVANANMGGTSTGFGVTQFGLGSFFGANFWAKGTANGTFLTQVVGTEVDASLAGSASRFAIMQLITTSDHAQHGVNVDTGLEIGSQVNASAGLRTLIILGDYESQWPMDANGYMMQAQSSENGNATTGAGGIDLSQAVFSGAGPEGGGFALRTPGTAAATAIDGTGGLKIGTGYISMNGGLSIAAPLWVLASNPTVNNGGTNFTVGDIVADGLGNILKIASVTGTTATGVSVVTPAEGRTANPSGIISTVTRTRVGTVYGSGLTVNETWVQNNKIGFYGNGPVAKQTPVGACASNTGCQALRDALANLGLITGTSITN